MPLSYQSLLEQEIKQIVALSLQQDLGGLNAEQGDVTAALIPAVNQGKATLITRESCVFVGKAWVEAVFQQLDDSVQIDWRVEDGAHLEANDVICQFSGSARSILTGERTALNLVQTLSATATATASAIKELAGTQTQLLDTRKTLPGMRFGQKYAVNCGGGTNHRIGLYDAFLIKENHIMAAGSIAAAVQQAKTNHPDKPVEVEVESVQELQQALSASVDIVMLDNFSTDGIHQAVAMTQGKAKLEVSGNITADRLKALAATGVDYISSGALTKHIQAIDLSLRFEK